MKQIGLILLIVQYAMCAIAQSNEDKAAVPQSEFECLYEYKVTNTKSITDTYTTILQYVPVRFGQCQPRFFQRRHKKISNTEDEKQHVLRPDCIAESSARRDVGLQCDTAG